MIVLTSPLTSLVASKTSDRYSNGLKYLNERGRPITSLRFLGERDGKFYYVDALDLTSALPPLVEQTSVALQGRLGGIEVN